MIVICKTCKKEYYYGKSESDFIDKESGIELFPEVPFFKKDTALEIFYCKGCGHIIFIIVVDTINFNLVQLFQETK